MGDITVRVRHSGRYYCQIVVQWAILLSECGTVGDITVRTMHSGRYYCQIVVQWAILLASLKHRVVVRSKKQSTSPRQTLQHAPTDTQLRILPNPESPVVPIFTIGFTVKLIRSAHTVHLCVLCGSENKQRLFPYTALTDWFL